MKNRLTLLIMFVLFCTSISFAQTTPIYVDDDYTLVTPGWGVTHFATISGGIAAVSSGGIVNVAAGTYTEHITINIPLTLRGPNNLISPVSGTRVAEAIINGTGADCSVNIQSGANPIIIEGLEFTGSNTSAAIFVDCDYVTIQKNLFTSVVGAAIQATNNTEITNRSNQLIDDNKIINISGGSNSGIYYHKITNSTISNNSITNTTYGGIYVGDANNSDHTKTVTISGNTLSTMPQQGIWVSDNSGNVIVSNNTITGANSSSTAGKGGITIYGTLYWGTVTVQNNTVSNSYNGLAIRTGQDITGKDIHVNFNNFANNSNAGVYNGTLTGPLDATNNWWGNASGPSHSSNTFTAVNLVGQVAVTNNVTFVPWWSTSTGTSFAPVTTTSPVASYASIQAGVTASNVGGTVNVAAGSFAEAVTINKNLSIVGSGNPTVTSLTLTNTAQLGGGSGGITAPNVYVNQTGGAGAKIQDGVLLSSSLGTLHVAAGTYGETVTVNKALTVTGSGTPTVNGFILTASPISITGFNTTSTAVIEVQSGGSIQDAIAIVNSGGTINVTVAGSYPHITINKQLSLIATVANVKITTASPAITVSATGVVINGVTFDFVTNEYAIDVTAGAYNVTIVNCDFLNSTFGLGVRNQGTGVVTATHNYWGSPHGPTVASSACGAGCTVNNASTGTLTYEPWFIDIGHGTLMYIPTLIFPASSSVGITVTPNFTWSFFAGSPTYTIEIATDNAFTNVVYGPVASLNLGTDAFYQLPDLNQLSNSTVYYWRIKATIGAATSCSIGSFTTITPAMPYLTYPSNGAILSGTTTSMYWYSGMVGINYIVQIAPGSDPTFLTPGGFLLNAPTTNTYYTVNNSIFTQGGTYYWRVIAKTLGGIVIDISNYWQFSMPGLPQVVGSYPVGGVTIYNNPPTLYWYPLGYNAKVTDYVVRVRKGAAPNQTTEDALPLSAGTQWVFRTSSINTFITIPIALDAGGTYYWDVASYDGSTTINGAYFTSNASPANSFVVYGNSTFIASYPSYPTAGSIVYTTTPTLYWYTNVYSPVIYYQVQVDDETGFTAPYKADITTGITTNSYTVLSSASLATGNTYYWRVRASIDNSNWGSWSSPASFVVSTTGTAASVATPYPATPNSGTVIGVTNPTLTWYAYSADPLQFRVTWATNPAVSGGTFTTPTGTSGWMTSNSFVLSGLTAGATYYWQVQARLATTLSEGAWSTVAWFTTSAGSASVVPLAGSPINGTPINNTNATLSWILPTQSTSTLKYDVQYSKQADFSDAVTISNLDKPNVEVKNLDKNSVYYWRAASTTNSGLTSSYSAPTSFNTGKTVTAIEEKVEQLPTQFELAQNYPNPFNPTTLISYALPQNAFVTLKVYDMLGREIKTLVSKEVAAGNYSVLWNGDDNFGNKVATGAYVYRITAGDPSASSGQGFVSVKKMLLIK